MTRFPRRIAIAVVLLSIATSRLEAQRAGGGGAGAAGRGAATPPPPPPPVKPVTFPTGDPVLKRIWALGMDSSWTVKLAQTLFDSIGPRLAGSPDMKRASDWGIKTYKSWGLDARAEQYGTWRGWRRGTSHIDLVAPRVRSLEGTMLGFSPGTGGKAITADAIILPTFADSNAFVKWLPEAKGKMVLVSPAMPTCRPSADYVTYATAWSNARMDSLRSAATQAGNARVRGTGLSLGLGTGTLGTRLENAGVAAVVTSRAKDAWGTIEIYETANVKAPAIGLSCEDYGLLYRLAESKQGPKLRLELEGELLGEQPAFNTVGVIKGTERPDEYVLLSAHFDSWDGGSGATDNGTGTIMMMEAMRILSTVYPRPKRTIMVGHWNGEEEGLVGSRAFAEDHKNDVLKGLQAVFNRDNGTGRVQRVGSNGLPDIESHGKSWFAKLPDYFTDSVAYTFTNSASGAPSGTDGTVFACYGAPAFSMGALNWNYGNYTHHTNRDTYDKIWFDDLKQNATLVAMLAYLASEDPALISREKSTNGTWPASCGLAPRVTKR